MIVYSVKVFVKKDHWEDFQQATIENHRETRQEKGNYRFDILQNDQDPGQFLLYEVYESAEAVEAHKKTAHYLKWRDTVAPWMAKSREGVRYQVVAPNQREEW
jgi:(4S)-4-hydroxy-5-phosphonooxypentane-2,3-dione isomerase